MKKKCEHRFAASPYYRSDLRNGERQIYPCMNDECRCVRIFWRNGEGSVAVDVNPDNVSETTWYSTPDANGKPHKA